MVGAPDAGAELLELGAPDDGRGFAGDWIALRTARAVRPPTRPATSTARELITRWIPSYVPDVADHTGQSRIAPQGQTNIGHRDVVAGMSDALVIWDG